MLCFARWQPSDKQTVGNGCFWPGPGASPAQRRSVVVLLALVPHRQYDHCRRTRDFVEGNVA
jgi:hypothetical protein